MVKVKFAYVNPEIMHPTLYGSKRVQHIEFCLQAFSTYALLHFWGITVRLQKDYFTTHRPVAASQTFTLPLLSAVNKIGSTLE